MSVKKKRLFLIFVLIGCLSTTIFFHFSSNQIRFNKIKKWFILLDYSPSVDVSSVNVFDKNN